MKTVRIRMYRQGLGDCFLLTFPREGTPAHVLIDCGVLKGTADAAATMRKVATNIVQTTGGVLDVLIVTHEHWDHLSGFLQAEEILSTLQVGQVWLAWTEDPKDEQGNVLRARKTKALHAVQGAAQRLNAATGEGPADDGTHRAAGRVAGLLEFFGGLGATGRQTTTGALEWVKSRPGARIVYLEPGEVATIPGVSDARAYVLGPPRDEKLLKRSDPSTRQSEVYELEGEDGSDLGFQAAVDNDPDTQRAQRPFDTYFVLQDNEARQEEFFATRYYTDAAAWRQIEHDWLDAASRLALKLDSDTNNTSLALAFELSPSQRVLLFPGDAQVGNWLSWDTLTWRSGDGDESRHVTTRDLLERTVLYKVGHHGSHNATLRAKGLELMSSPELTAMVPVDRTTAQKMAWNMPFPALWTELQQRTGGRILDLERGLVSPASEPTASPHWTQFTSRVDQQDDWIDYTVEYGSA